jgi:hypothetical protein
MAAKGECENAGVDLELQGFGAVDANISTIQKAVGLPPSGLPELNHEAIRDLGCRIVARALDVNDGSTVAFD